MHHSNYFHIAYLNYLFHVSAELHMYGAGTLLFLHALV
jgi:hypothetical protein